MNKPPPPTAATIAYKEAGLHLQLEMGISYTGDSDADFTSLLLAYGKGTAALARIALEHGKDPEIRRIAQHVLESEAKQAERLQAWRAAHP